MENYKAPNIIVVGLALFSMFFGSGNLIFPLYLGATYQNYFFISCLGFVITSVLLPTLGIIAMMPAHGQYERLFLGLGGQRFARWFFLIILAFWIPFGSGPRCVVLAHASIMTFSPLKMPLWLFSFVFLFLIYICVQKRNNIIDILGKILTPLLLLSIISMVIASLSSGQINIIDVDAKDVLFKSLIDGYYTQDLIAAIFFSSALVTMVNARVKHEKEALKIVMKASILAISLLFFIYLGLMAASAVHGENLAHLSGEKLVSNLALLSLGQNFGGISSIAVSLACFTTEVALVLVFADFLSHNVFHKSQSHRALILTLIIIGALSLLEFQRIMAIISPAMQIIYPLLFLLVLRFLILNIKNPLGRNK